MEEKVEQKTVQPVKRNKQKQLKADKVWQYFPWQVKLSIALVMGLLVVVELTL